MIQIYLFINAFSYLGFSLWCLIKAETTAKALGYNFSKTMARWNISACIPAWNSASLYFSPYAPFIRA